MFETLSYSALQHYWWFIISVLAAFLVFFLFVQGGQTLIYVIGKSSTEQTLIVNSLGRKWEFTFTTLVVFGGAFFASFPLFYSTSFGGAYWLWMSILFCFVIQAVSYEYRSKPNNFLGKKTFDAFLFINGALGTFLLGVAVATFFTGANFTVNLENIANQQQRIISQWASPWHGLEAVADWRNVLLGLAIFFLARTLALLYFMNNIDHAEIFQRSRKHLIYNSIPFVLFFVAFLVVILTIDGQRYDAANQLVFMEPNKFLKNFLELPFLSILLLLGVLLTLLGIGLAIFRNSTKGIWFSGSGVILVVFALFMILAFNGSCYYPSNIDFQSSLHLGNSSSSFFTLTVMSYVSTLVPFVAAYMFWAWKAINRKKISEKEINEESGHVY
ncbi:MAG: cytochrome d ubiquinol oxidase subunit II [Bacteroidales bacterium]|nr:cytochrome d ubiquinol oxidase subunit II [Bacteroidales bacterium]